MDSLPYRSTKWTGSTWPGTAHPVTVQSFSGCVLGSWISPLAQDLCVTLGPRGIAAAQQGCSLCRACSVQSVSGYSIWETWPRQLAWHTTVLDIPAGSDTPPLSSAGAAALVPRLLGLGLHLCLSLTATAYLLEEILDCWRIPSPMALAEPLSLQQLVLGSSNLSQERFHDTEMQASYPTSLSMPYMPGKDWAALCQYYRWKVTMNGLNTGGISALNTKIVGF